MAFENLPKLISDYGILGVFVFILAAGARRVWVWGWQYRQIEHERDVWRQVALEGTDIAKGALNLAKGDQ